MEGADVYALVGFAHRIDSSQYCFKMEASWIFEACGYTSESIERNKKSSVPSTFWTTGNLMPFRCPLQVQTSSFDLPIPTLYGITEDNLLEFPVPNLMLEKLVHKPLEFVIRDLFDSWHAGFTPTNSLINL
jgi:hypothetical protein